MDLCEVERCDRLHRLQHLLLSAWLLTVDTDRVQLMSVPVEFFHALI